VHKGKDRRTIIGKGRQKEIEEHRGEVKDLEDK
jgi:hypothetical protein